MTWLGYWNALMRVVTSVCLVKNKLLIADNSVFQGSREDDNEIIRLQLKIIALLADFLQAIDENENKKQQEKLFKKLMKEILYKKMSALFKGALMVNIPTRERETIA